jgi:hypothetical protein
MDVLHFMKEEYSKIREVFPGLAPGDMGEALSGAALHSFMVRLDLVIRVGGELIIPELVDAGRTSSAAAMLAEEQAKSLVRVIASFKKVGDLPDTKRADIFRKIYNHVEQMEKIVLPLVRELIPTAVREDIGEIALDYRSDVGALVAKSSKHLQGSTISA